MGPASVAPLSPRHEAMDIDCTPVDRPMVVATPVGTGDIPPATSGAPVVAPVDPSAGPVASGHCIDGALGDFSTMAC